jgi:hypothetical protein
MMYKEWSERVAAIQRTIQTHGPLRWNLIVPELTAAMDDDLIEFVITCDSKDWAPEWHQACKNEFERRLENLCLGGQ